MKKMLLKFADNLLSREQMREVKGGYGAFAKCTATCSFGAEVSCNTVGASSCYSTDYQGVKCDGITHCCPTVINCNVA